MTALVTIDIEDITHVLDLLMLNFREYESYHTNYTEEYNLANLWMPQKFVEQIVAPDRQQRKRHTDRLRVAVQQQRPALMQAKPPADRARSTAPPCTFRLRHR